jgi:hypothetical protein
MPKESILVLNDIEKQIADKFMQKLITGDIPPKGENVEPQGIYHLNYEYYSGKQEKIVRGVMLGCAYKLRYKDGNRIFFSAWDCKDVCGMFYDVVMIICTLAKQNIHIEEFSRPFDVDLHTEAYVFFTGDVAASFVRMTDHISKDAHRLFLNSQYTFSVFDESDKGEYGALIQQLKAEDYSKIQVLQVWIRGEILYYAIADGAVLRPPNQRILGSREEEDFIRKIGKTVNHRFRPMALDKAI